MCKFLTLGFFFSLLKQLAVLFNEHIFIKVKDVLNCKVVPARREFSPVLWEISYSVTMIFIDCRFPATASYSGNCSGKSLISLDRKTLFHVLDIDFFCQV